MVASLRCVLWPFSGSFKRLEETDLLLALHFFTAVRFQVHLCCLVVWWSFVIIWAFCSAVVQRQKHHFSS